MKRRSTGDHVVTASDVDLSAVEQNAGSVIKRGHHPQPSPMYDPHSLAKRIYAIRIKLRGCAHRRSDVISTLTVLDRAITKLRREEIDLVEALHRLAPDRLEQLDESTSDWRST